MSVPKRAGPSRRRGLSIFNRTFLLLLAALLVAQGIAVALLVLSPIRSGSVELMQVIALLSSRIPSNDTGLHVETVEAAPTPDTEKGLRNDETVRAWIARWLGVETDTVVFATNRTVRQRGGGPGRDGHAPPPRRDAEGSTAGEQPQRGGFGPPPSGGGPPPHDRLPPPDRPPPDGDGPPGGNGPPPDGELAPDTVLRGDFIAAVRQRDGRWRVVESSEAGLLMRIGKPAGLLFLLGLFVLLPLAWWFSRALSAPIRRFARAADHLGRNPDAPPLPHNGPSEIAMAADSFNAMQTRLNRMIAERTQMAGAIAHDLRTPLARLAFRLHKLPPGEQEKAQADIDEMKSMIASALEFLRDQSQRGSRGRLDFRSLVESVVDGLADTGHDVTLQTGASATVVGDPVALRRMVANLADNALKYGHRARLCITVEADVCRLHVEDDGPGIDPAQAERLFMPFARGEASRNRNTGGVGLGLSSVQGIVASHGGEVTLRNRDEGGLQVTVTLPLERA
ncbi:MAG: ATP-binding protein [Pseudoxanthomonas sp.]